MKFVGAGLCRSIAGNMAGGIVNFQKSEPSTTESEAKIGKIQRFVSLEFGALVRRSDWTVLMTNGDA